MRGRRTESDRKEMDLLDPVWRALADPTRRAMLDALKEGPRATGELAGAFPEITRFGVMKHLGVLEEAGLVTTRKEGRRRLNYLNPIPIRKIYERWVSGFSEVWSSPLLNLAEKVEGGESAPH